MSFIDQASGSRPVQETTDLSTQASATGPVQKQVDLSMQDHVSI